MSIMVSPTTSRCAKRCRRSTFNSPISIWTPSSHSCHPYPSQVLLDRGHFFQVRLHPPVAPRPYPPPCCAAPLPSVATDFLSKLDAPGSNHSFLLSLSSMLILSPCQTCLDQCYSHGAAVPRPAGLRLEPRVHRVQESGDTHGPSLLDHYSLDPLTAPILIS